MNDTMKTIMMNMLGGADSLIREYGDEEVLEPWLMCGVPDGATEEDLADIAEDLDEFIDIMECFVRRLKQIKECEG